MTTNFAMRRGLPHQQILVGIYASIAVFLVAEIALFWNDAVYALRDYLTGGGFAGVLAIALAYTTPLSSAAVAYIVYARLKGSWLFLPVAHTIIVFPLATLPALYLLWWRWHSRVRHGNSN